jgi:hypothetical protein
MRLYSSTPHSSVFFLASSAGNAATLRGADCVPEYPHSEYASIAYAAGNFPILYIAPRIPCTCILDKGRCFDFPLRQEMMATIFTPYELWSPMYKNNS